MHYAFLLCFSYVFYNSEAKVNALFKICIMRLCIMRISTVAALRVSFRVVPGGREAVREAD